MDPLFPELPEGLNDPSVVSDEDLAALIAEHEEAKEAIRNDDAAFLKDLSADEVIAQLKTGVEQIKLLEAEIAARTEANENYIAEKEKILAELKAEDEPEAEVEGSDEEEEKTEEAEAELVAEAETEEVEEEKVEDKELVLAAAPAPRFSRTPPAAALERQPKPVVVEEKVGTALVAAGEMSLQYRDPLDENSLADLVKSSAMHYGPHPKIDPPGKYRFGGPEHKIARADFEFPEERTLSGDVDEATEKIRAVIPNTNLFLGRPGDLGGEALVASGGLCAPLTPFYSMPNFATEAEPVWDALPVFRAARGGVNTPEATVIGDITTAISSISEANDALGGTFATKSCQDLVCPPYTEVAVQILAHCREYGNLNARAWPEKIAHENALTMAALSRTSEGFMLDRIKALSVNVTVGAETLGALIYIVEGIVKSMWGIRSRLRMPREARFRALLPAVLLDMLLLDNISTQFDRFRSRAELDAYLRSTGIDPVYYIDEAAGGEEVADASQAAGALDGLPNVVQVALYPEGTFLGIDSGTLELGIVRDSVLNATNDFQVFGERFRNVARIGPAQAAYWISYDICPTGQFPPAGTVRTCE